MTALALTALLAGGLITLAIAGPWLLRQAAPTLVRIPRLAIALTSTGVVAWLGSLLAVGPVLAWAGSGPALLPEPAAAVCRRCLAAATPFGLDASSTAVPAALLLALPAAFGLTLATSLASHVLHRERRSRHAAEGLLLAARRRIIRGHTVSVIDSDHPFALALPRRHGGVLLSTGALATLDAVELDAVLAHEQAHLRQHHHAINMLVTSLAALLRWVPLIRAAADALPHYLEIAADDQARRRTSTSALVSALVKLSNPSGHSVPPHAPAEALHAAAGPSRVRQLVQPAVGPTGTIPTVLAGLYVAALAVIGAAAHAPYLVAALTGC
ncbi:BlaR1 peptidase M56 [Salana multivorans]|uniref:BlaR1 peptidase M56 n=1 Tax=Salana multivorans TaxID=120377 RepID=A0A3N2D934_9MICO|nr:M56 family metallopeptidase [Salana multivorans]ROR96307.1 BlaR1 peptidase M56 [Salana multivorans]